MSEGDVRAGAFCAIVRIWGRDADIVASFDGRKYLGSVFGIFCGVCRRVRDWIAVNFAIASEAAGPIHWAWWRAEALRHRRNLLVLRSYVAFGELSAIAEEVEFHLFGDNFLRVGIERIETEFVHEHL